MIAFRAHRAEVNQTGFTANVYNPVYFPNESHDQTYNAVGYDAGGRFASSLWVPVQTGEDDAVVQFSGQIWIPDGQATPGNGDYYVARICKNGNQPTGKSICARIATRGPFTYDWVIALDAQDVASAGDSYGVYLFTSNAGITVDGCCLHTWWSGVVL